ncbi:MAG: hypothetical protein GY950_17540 [bacterium]|nr:hypothetical protein [bacterium]
MICKFYRFMFWLIPLKRWQSFLVETHFDGCTKCGEPVDENKIIHELVISPRRADASASLWPGVRRGILPRRQPAPAPVRRGWKRQWTGVVFALAVVAALLVIPFVLQKETGKNVSPGKQINRLNSNISIRSVKLEGKHAHSYVFNSTDPEMTMVWVERK